MTEFLAELPEIGDTVNIDVDAECGSFLNFTEINIVGSIKYAGRLKAGLQSEFHFVDRTAIDITTNAAYVL
jgi:hypothetical protein